MSNAAIYAINPTTGTVVTDGGTVPFTQVVRRFGCALGVDNNNVVLKDRGYYYVDADITAVATAVGDIVVSLYQDGVVVPGAVYTSSVAAIGDVVTIPVSAIVRKTGCECNNSVLTVVVSGQGVTLDTATIAVIKA